MTRRELHELLGTRWALPLLETLAAGPARAAALKQANPGISGRMQSVTLKQLEGAGMVDREVKAVRPPHVVYSLTTRGRSALSWSALGTLAGADQKRSVVG